MMLKKIVSCVLVAFAFLAASLPTHAGMVATEQMDLAQPAMELNQIGEQRDWLRQQLITGGVAQVDADLRLNALTDLQVSQIHQRIDQAPAGGNVFLWAAIGLVLSEYAGWTDLIPAIRPLDY